MVLRDPLGIAYVAVAVICVCIAAITWRRRALNPIIAASLTAVMLGAGWWAACIGVAAGSADQTVAGSALLARFPGVGLMVAAFVCLGLAIARPHWAPKRRFVAALLVEPVMITVAAATNPWHLLVYRGPGAARLTGSDGWTFGLVFWLHDYYSYAALALGVALIAWSWWNASPAFRPQRLVLLTAVLPPFAVSAIFVHGGLGDIPDPTSLCFAATGAAMAYAIFRQGLFTFSPVARALIVDQIGDAVVVVSVEGRVLDLNRAAVALAGAIDADAPTALIGALAVDLFGEGVATVHGQDTEVVVETVGGRIEFQVRSSRLIDGRHRDLGTVFVARNVTEANAVSRRLAAAHTELVRQVQTIEVLRADLVELASRDPLTGLHNRRHLVERFASMLAAAQFAGETLAVALFDIDRFKSVNDRYGHLAGDAVLVTVAQRIQDQAPPGALVARWGGEELFVALPGAAADAGLAFADDLRRRCEQEATIFEERRIPCTISAGVATYPASGTTADGLFHAADVSMYEAKKAGRNLVCLYQDDVARPPLRTAEVPNQARAAQARQSPNAGSARRCRL